MRRPIIFILLFSFILTGLPRLEAQELKLPNPGVMVHLSPQFSPAILKGIKVHPDNPFKFEFILDKGEAFTNLRSSETARLKEEANRLIRYFLASVTTPERDLWVNLSPYEKDRIIPSSFGLTEMGRDLLAQDYMLKQITASLIYPEDEVGKKFWKRIYEEAAKKYGNTNIAVNTFNKVWIVPEKAVVYENAKAGTAYVVESRLKVMLEEDYLSLSKSVVAGVPAGQKGQKGQAQRPVRTDDSHAFASQIIREIVIPELTKEVNEGKNFAQLRQVYNSLILASWYKKKIKDSILSKVYADKNKTKGIDTDDPSQKDEIYKKYIQAFKKGVYNYIKEEVDPQTQQANPRKYFSGGFKFSTDKTMTVQDIFDSKWRKFLVGLTTVAIIGAVVSPYKNSAGQSSTRALAEESIKAVAAAESFASAAKQDKLRDVQDKFLSTFSSFRSDLPIDSKDRMAPLPKVMALADQMEQLIMKVSQKEIMAVDFKRMIHANYYYLYIQKRLVQMMVNIAKAKKDERITKHMLKELVEAFQGEIAQGSSDSVTNAMFVDVFNQLIEIDDQEHHLTAEQKEKLKQLKVTLDALLERYLASRDFDDGNLGEKPAQKAFQRWKEVAPEHALLLTNETIKVEMFGGSKELKREVITNGTDVVTTVVSIGLPYNDAQHMVMEIGAKIYEKLVLEKGLQKEWRDIASRNLIFPQYQGLFKELTPEAMQEAIDQEAKTLFMEDYGSLILSGALTSTHWPLAFSPVFGHLQNNLSLEGGYGAGETEAARWQFFQERIFNGKLKKKPTAVDLGEQLNALGKELTPPIRAIYNEVVPVKETELPILHKEEPTKLEGKPDKTMTGLTKAVYILLSAASVGTLGWVYRDTIKKYMVKKMKLFLFSVLSLTLYVHNETRDYSSRWNAYLKSLLLHRKDLLGAKEVKIPQLSVDYIARGLLLYFFTFENGKNSDKTMRLVKELAQYINIRLERPLHDKEIREVSRLEAAILASGQITYRPVLRDIFSLLKRGDDSAVNLEYLRAAQAGLFTSDRFSLKATLEAWSGSNKSLVDSWARQHNDRLTQFVKRSDSRTVFIISPILIFFVGGLLFLAINKHPESMQGSKSYIYNYSKQEKDEQGIDRSDQWQEISDNLSGDLRSSPPSAGRGPRVIEIVRGQEYLEGRELFIVSVADTLDSPAHYSGDLQLNQTNIFYNLDNPVTVRIAVGGLKKGKIKKLPFIFGRLPTNIRGGNGKIIQNSLTTVTATEDIPGHFFLEYDLLETTQKPVLPIQINHTAQLAKEITSLQTNPGFKDLNEPLVTASNAPTVIEDISNFIARRMLYNINVTILPHKEGTLMGIVGDAIEKEDKCRGVCATAAGVTDVVLESKGIPSAVLVGYGYGGGNIITADMLHAINAYNDHNQTFIYDGTGFMNIESANRVVGGGSSTTEKLKEQDQAKRKKVESVNKEESANKEEPQKVGLAKVETSLPENQNVDQKEGLVKPAKDSRDAQVGLEQSSKVVENLKSAQKDAEEEYTKAQEAFNNFMKDHPKGAMLLLDAKKWDQILKRLQKAKEELKKFDRESDNQMGTSPIQRQGGIDFTSDKNLQVKNAGEGIQFHLDAAMLAQLQNAPGFTPQVTYVLPVSDLTEFLGIGALN